MSGFYTGKLIKLPGFQLIEQFNFGSSQFKTGTITQTPSTYYQLIPNNYNVTASTANNAFFDNHTFNTGLISFPKIYLYLNSTWTTTPACCIEIRFNKDCDLIHWSSANGYEETQYGENTSHKYKLILEEHYFLYSLDREYIFYATEGKALSENIFGAYHNSSDTSYVHVIWKNKKTVQFWMSMGRSSNNYFITKSNTSYTGSDNFIFTSSGVFATPLEGYQYLTT